mgnify:CR=1 FL=1
MKKWGALGLAAVLLMSVWGCLPTEDPGKTQPPSADGGMVWVTSAGAIISIRNAAA